MNTSKKLSQSQVRFLRGQAHHLNPVIMIGSKGVTDSLMEELETSLNHHELIKIKMAAGDKESRAEVIQHILHLTRAHLIQSIGKVFVIYREKEKPEIILPKS